MTSQKDFDESTFDLSLSLEQMDRRSFRDRHVRRAASLKHDEKWVAEEYLPSIASFIQNHCHSHVKVPADVFDKVRKTIVWKLTREFCFQRGLLPRHRPLIDLMGDAFTSEDGEFFDPWELPREVRVVEFNRSSQYGIGRSRSMSAIDTMARLLSDKEYPSILSSENAPKTRMFGLPVMPPDVPDHFLDRTREIVRHYFTADDRLLALWLKAMGVCVPGCNARVDVRVVDDSMGTSFLMREGSAMRLLDRLLDPEECRVLWLTPTEILDFEKEIVVAAVTRIRDHSESAALFWLEKSLGASSEIAEGVIQMARDMIVGLSRINEDEQKALLILRYFQIAKVARDSGQLRTEVLTLREIGRLSGLYQSATAKDELSQALESLKKAGQIDRTAEAPMLSPAARMAFEGLAEIAPAPSYEVVDEE